MEERLHKLLAQHGLGSRRQVEAWIAEGRVLVNGRPAEIGQRVGPNDRVVVDGRDVTKRVQAESKLRVILYHKPSGEMLRRQEGDDRANVDVRLPALRAGRWLPINALGFGEDGLLVLSSDGSFVSAITRKAATIPVEYRVRSLRPRQSEEWPEMPLEVDVEGEPVTFSAVERLEGGTTKLFDAAGLKISRTMLVKWGPVALPRDLPRGRSRDLAGAELDALLALGERVVTPARRTGAARKPGPRGRRAGPRRGRAKGGG